MTRLATALFRVAAVTGLLAVLVAAPTIQSQLADSGLSEWAREAAANRLSRDAVRDGQWQIHALRAREAWRYSTGKGVTVAVIDSGVAAGHPDLQGQVLPGLDLVKPEGGDGTDDQAGHGTTVAGLIAGRGDDNDGVIGLAPDAKILPIRVLNAENEYDDPSLVAEAVIWAVDHGAKVINLSLGSGSSSTVLAEAIDYAFARDVVVVACVGNTMASGSTRIWHPAREPGVLAVTALRPDGKIWGEALSGAETVLAAPGAGLLAARPNGYAEVEGTSFAAPLVSAAAALIRSRTPALSAANVVQRLIATASDRGTPGRDGKYGFGVVDPVAALTADVATVAANPLDTTPPVKAAFGAARSSRHSVVPAPSAAGGPYLAGAAARAPGGDGPPIGLAAAVAGLVVLVGGGITLLRRL